MKRAPLARRLALLMCASLGSIAAAAPNEASADLRTAAAQAEAILRQSFSNLQFVDFRLSPVRGTLYQASAGGRILYFAPESGHLLFASVYDRDGVNLTALAEDENARRKLAAIDPATALVIGPAGAPTVIEFTDPDCPYCRSLESYWATKATEGKPIRRLVYFVTGIHPQAAAKAEHILCSPDPAAAFRSIYAGAAPPELRRCTAGKAKIAADAALVRTIGVSGTPTLVVDGRLLAGFQQGELEEFLNRPHPPVPK